ncbi:hypothetical protein ACFX14_018952 [Malus domestica]|uniref:uncharacterized protein isoform X1 n=1 Tax=Malus domestica TaxID=3750 RepID=UPI003974903C
MPVRASVAKAAQQSTTLRRSPRFLHHQKTQEPELSTATLRKSQRLVCLEKSAAESENPRTPKSTARSNRVVRSLSLPLSSKNSSESHDGPRRSPRLNNGVEAFQRLRRSSRILNKQLVLVDEGKGPSKQISKKLGKLENGSSNCGNLSSGSAKCRRKSVRFCIDQSIVNQCTDKATGSRSKSGKNRSLKKEEFSSVGKDGACIDSSERVSKECKMQEIDGVNKEVGVRRKRKREEENGKREEEGVGVVQGWTKEQEFALQRAYLIAKPTPHFWKKVSKLVPGKSAQECFDRVHSEHRTPPQPHTRSRASTLTNSSPLGQFSLSASKLLKPSEPKSKRQECSKQRRHVAQKTVRQLLQKHNQVYQDYEGDLFWVLEPSLGSPSESHASVIPSTPKNLQEKKKILQNRSQRSSSGHKKRLLRFSSSCGKPLVSPRVLKQVRNKVRHEKYIDQLHTREATRKAASTRTQQSTSGIGEVDAVRTAKIALVSDARDAINKLQHLQANVTGDSSDFDDGGIISDDEEGEDDT